MTVSTQQRLELKRQIRSEHRANVGAIRERERLLFGKPVSREIGVEEDVLTNQNETDYSGSTIRLRFLTAIAAFVLYAVFYVSTAGENDWGIQIGALPASSVIKTIDNEIKKDFNMESIAILNDFATAFGKNKD